METIKKISLKSESTNFERVRISDSQTSAEVIRKFYFDDITIFESVFLLMLDNNNSSVAYAKISQGGITGAVVDVRIIAKYAVESLCTSVIVAHNHPSGRTTPSEADKIITKKIKTALSTLDIQLLDHIIITETEHFSFADEGIL